MSDFNSAELDNFLGHNSIGQLDDLYRREHKKSDCSDHGNSF